MVAAGRTEIAEVLVVADSPVPVTPCGGCRQKLAEFAAPDDAGDPRRASTASGRAPPSARCCPAPSPPEHLAGRRRDATATCGTPRARALACLDLTNLDDGCDAAAIDALCRRRADAARRRSPRSASGRASWRRRKRALAGTGIRVATVVNFPDGDDAAGGGPRRDPRGARRRRRRDRPGGALARARRRATRRRSPPRCARSRTSAARATLKAILETGELEDPGLIRRAADEALAGGADFLKTSTGKVAVNATPEAAEILLDAIRDSGRDAGLKPAGGVRTTADAARLPRALRPDDGRGLGHARALPHRRLGRARPRCSPRSTGRRRRQAGKGY